MNLKTLIIDDNSVIHFLHGEIVTDGGISSNPKSFLHGKEAMEYLLNNQDNDDAYFILLDLNMPIMNGWQFLDELQKYSKKEKTFVIIVSSSVDLSDKKKANAYPQVIGFFEKPFSEEDCNAIKTSPSLLPFFN